MQEEEEIACRKGEGVREVGRRREEGGKEGRRMDTGFARNSCSL